MLIVKIAKGTSKLIEHKDLPNVQPRHRIEHKLRKI